MQKLLKINHYCAINSNVILKYRYERFSLQIKNRIIFRIGATLGVLAIIAGSIGSHGIKFADEKAQKLYETGLLYLLIHLPVILICGVLDLKKQAYLMTAGVLMFSIPLLAKGIGVFDGGIIVPTGGMLMIVSWIWLIFIEKSESNDN